MDGEMIQIRRAYHRYATVCRISFRKGEDVTKSSLTAPNWWSMSADDSDKYSYKLYTSCPSFCLLLYFIWIENCDVSRADFITEGFRIAKHQKLRFLLLDTCPILFDYNTVCRVKSNEVSSIASIRWPWNSHTSFTLSLALNKTQ